MNEPIVVEIKNEPGTTLVNKKHAHVGHPVKRPVIAPILNSHFPLFFGRLFNANAINITFHATSVEIVISNTILIGINIAPICSVKYFPTDYKRFPHTISYSRTTMIKNNRHNEKLLL